jgi:hypothetical protein
VRDEGPGRKRQGFVENEQREKVCCIGDADRRRDGDCKADIKSRLMLLIIAAHVTNRKKRIDDPQNGGEGGKHRAERLGFERDWQAANDRQKEKSRPLALSDGCKYDERERGKKAPGG